MGGGGVGRRGRVYPPNNFLGEGDFFCGVFDFWGKGAGAKKLAKFSPATSKTLPLRVVFFVFFC